MAIPIKPSQIKIAKPAGGSMKTSLIAKTFGILLPLLSLVSAPVKADAVSDFYKGKQVTLIVGYGTGGGYDVYARLLAKHLGKHIPGAPNVIVQNMPGAGSLRAANFIYSNAPKDGTQIATFSRDMPLMSILGGNANVQFDSRKFTWLGSPSSYGDDAYLLFVRKDANVKTIEDARRTNGPKLILGGTAEGATGNDIAILLRDALGINLQIITGYPDSGALFLAADRKEIDGRLVGMSAVNSSKAEWMNKDSNMHVLMQFARITRHPAFPDVPTARELAKDDRSRALIEIAEMPYTLSRPFVAPPGIPEDRAKALQKAFMDVNSDPNYIEDAKKLKIDISPIDGQAVLTMIDRLSKSPPDLLDYIKKLQGENKDGG
jgi:tripartite-type tricarboxylate transporter receptor subunit TctC